jgi:hypothetical protein
MELVILLVAVIGVLGWFIWKDKRSENNSGHPLDGATKSAFLDVNKDGKVDVKDAVAVVEVVAEEVKTVTKKAATKAKKVAVDVEAKVETAVKKVKSSRKPKAK